MLVNRLAGWSAASSKYLIDDVIGRSTRSCWCRWRSRGAATLVQALLVRPVAGAGVAAQKAITDMRRPRRGARARLPVRYFDSTKSGRAHLADHDRRRGHPNLVGNGLVALVGSVVTAVWRSAYLFYLNWVLTLVNIVALGAFGFAMATAFKRCAAVPRARQDQRRGHRPPERNAGRHPHRQDLHRGEARGAGLHEGGAQALSQRRAVDHRRLLDHRVLDRDHRDHRRHHDHRRRPRDPRGHDDVGDF
jgi:ABC-type multidrug transport system fused ATPase/permease subunit